MMFINPKAGQLNGFTSAAEIKAKLTAHGLNPEIYLARSSRGIASFVAKVKRQQPKTVIVAGGDGTIGAVIKGLITQPVKFGLIPTGSLNNIASTLRIDTDIDQALSVIKAAKTAKIDAAQAGGVAFLEAVGIGLIARIFDNTDWDKDKNKLQMAGVTAAEMLSPAPIQVRGAIDGNPVQFETVWLTIGNNCKIGTLTLDPDSKIDDGYLDLVYCQPLSLSELPKYAASFIKSTHLELGKFQTIRAKQLQLQFNGPHRVHIDDRVVKRRQLTVEILPSVVEVFVP